MQVHSRVKLVTNSSSETYMFVKNDQIGVDKLKEFINKVLNAGGSLQTADELFDFELVPINSYLDDERDWLESEGREPDSWSMLRKYPNGIHTIKVTPKAGAEDLGKLLFEVFDAQEIGNGN